MRNAQSMGRIARKASAPFHRERPVQVLRPS
jgi:hypothetical protein